jgi:hypothetical protein
MHRSGRQRDLKLKRHRARHGDFGRYPNELFHSLECCQLRCPMVRTQLFRILFLAQRFDNVLEMHIVHIVLLDVSVLDTSSERFRCNRHST